MSFLVSPSALRSLLPHSTSSQPVLRSRCGSTRHDRPLPIIPSAVPVGNEGDRSSMLRPSCIYRLFQRSIKLLVPCRNTARGNDSIDDTMRYSGPGFAGVRIHRERDGFCAYRSSFAKVLCTGPPPSFKVEKQPASFRRCQCPEPIVRSSSD